MENTAFREVGCSQIKMNTITIMMVIIVIIFYLQISRCYTLLYLYSLYMHLSRTPKNETYLYVVGFTKDGAQRCCVGSLSSPVAASCVVYPQMEGFIWGCYPQFNPDEHHCEVWGVSFMTHKL